MAEKKVYSPNCYKSSKEIDKYYDDYRHYFQSGHFNSKCIAKVERRSWKKGDQVEVYNDSDGYWHGAEIIKVSHDKKSIMVQFYHEQALMDDVCLTKELLLRNSDHLRPMSLSLSVYVNEIYKMQDNHQIELDELEMSQCYQNFVLRYAWECKFHETEKAYKQEIDILQQSISKCESEITTQNKQIDFMSKIIHDNNQYIDDIKCKVVQLKQEIKQKDFELYEYSNRVLSQNEIKTRKKALKQLNKYLNQKLKEREDKLKQTELQIEEQNECIVCMDCSIEFACVPCGHLCLCSECASQINDHCPLCRNNIESVLRIYCK